MKIAVASGKGGTGKTTVATNLAETAVQNARTVNYLDCDVEEPNGALFLRPEITESRPVYVNFPEVDPDQCIGCGLCGEICQFNAIVCVKDKVLVFPELCHACGGCMLVCPTNAITETQRAIGRLEQGVTNKMLFTQGILDIGQIMSPPLIQEVKAAASDCDVVIVDAPPGSSCPVIESVRNSDFVLLVTEPTPFGLHDLRLAVNMVRALALPFGVIINRQLEADSETHRFCHKEAIPILAEIPDDRRIAEAYSHGTMMCQAFPAYRKLFLGVLKQIENRVAIAATTKAER